MTSENPTEHRPSDASTATTSDAFPRHTVALVASLVLTSFASLVLPSALAVGGGAVAIVLCIGIIGVCTGIVATRKMIDLVSGEE